MRRARRPVTPSLLVLAFLLAVAACGPLRQGSASESATVSFANESLNPADVFAVTASGATRIGSVQGGRTEELTVPAHLVRSGGGVRIVARLFPTRNTVETERLTLLPGDRIVVRLPSMGNFLAVLPGD